MTQCGRAGPACGRASLGIDQLKIADKLDVPLSTFVTTAQN